MPNTIDWRTLPVGRELDALVHRLVFGKCAHTARSFVRHVDGHGYEGRRCTECGDVTDQAGFIYWYSASWDNAARVVKHLAPWDANGLPAGLLTFDLSMTGQSGWLAGFTPLVDDCTRYAGQAETAPLAICRAALAAVEAQHA